MFRKSKVKDESFHEVKEIEVKGIPFEGERRSYLNGNLVGGF